MDRLARGVAGRRTKWVAVAIWVLAIFIAAGPAQLVSKFSDAEENESTSFLPGDAESTKALEKSEALQDGEKASIVIVYRREGGLTAADRQRIRADQAELNGLNLRATTPFSTVPPTRTARIPASPDGTAALLSADITSDGESDTILDPVDEVRDRVSGSSGGLEVKVTGAAGFSADAIKVFESINGTLLLAASALVFFLLIVIYRSPFFLFIPLLAVAFAEMMSRAICYGLTEVGVTVNGQSSSILSVLVLGAGTDYALLLVARYREELRKHEDRHEAMELAMKSAGPAILASGMTVIAALLCLTVAELNGTAGLGPIGAIGIAVAMISMLTLLPALLVIFGRRAFWPFIPHLGDEGSDATHGRWRRIADRVSAKPRRVWVGTVALLLVLSLGLLNFDDGLTTGNSYREDVESVEGQELLSQSFPGGANAPTEVIVPPNASVAAVARAVNGTEGVASVRPAFRGEEGTLLQAVLEPDPYSTEAFALVEPLRETAKAAGGDEVLVGGATAVEFDVRESAARDNRVIVPMALLVVFIVLVLLLRALVAPVLLILTVILSFAASPGRGRGGVRRDLRLPRQRPVPAAVRLRLPGGPGHRLQHLPHGPGAGGNDPLRHPRGHEARPGGHRRRYHRRGNRAGGHLLGARCAAARVPDRDRVRDRLRGAAGHLPRALAAGAGPLVRARPPDLVAVDAVQLDRAPRAPRAHGRRLSRAAGLA